MKTPPLSPFAVAAQRARRRAAVGRCAVGLGLATGLAAAAHADPQGGAVVAGQAAISRSGPTTTISQSSPRAAIDWRSFNVTAGETVRFDQPNAASATLNRVVGNQPSSIFGRITANGIVLLVNPDGILFGRTAQVNVAGLVASTANIGNADFMAGRFDFKEPGRRGATVENQGTITIGDGGLAALVGRGVANSGVIEARLGKVSLAAGDAFVLDLYGDHLVNLIIDPAVMRSTRDASGVALAARVDQSGRIVAGGGVVQLTAAAVTQLVDRVVNVGRVVRATAFDTAPGRITLKGDTASTVALSGTIDVSGAIGGRVDATAATVRLTPTASIDASGRDGGGVVTVGGRRRDAGGAALRTGLVEVARGARIVANATRTGAGGIVDVWSDGDTRFDGTVVARGGAFGGDGGRVEVSSGQRLAFDGDVDASAVRGRSGTLLLDPTNLVVDGAAGGASLPGANAAGDFVVNVDAVRRPLVNGTSVTLQATQDLTINANAIVDGRSPTGGVAGGGLDLLAGRDVTVNGLVLLNDGRFSATAGRAFTEGADAVIATGSGGIGISAGGAIAATNLLTTGDVRLASSGGAVAVSRVLSGGATARTGTIDIAGRDGVVLNEGALAGGAVSLTSSAGKVVTSGATIAATGAIAFDGAVGVEAAAIVTPATVTLTSRGPQGHVTLTGPVAGDQGAVDRTSAAAAGLRIDTTGDVRLVGGALGSGGLVVTGTSSGQAGSFALAGASLFSRGPVSVATVGDVALGTGVGVVTSGSVPMRFDAGGSFVSSNGLLDGGGLVALTAGASLTIGSGGIRSAQDVQASAGGGLVVGGPIAVDGGTIRLAAGGSVDLASTVATWQSTAASGFLDIDAGTDVVLQKALGGPDSGYTALATPGYRAAQRPSVGKVRIVAGRDVELNGLNLDGNTDPCATTCADSTPGLSVVAGHRLVSNNLVAVNKGAVVLQSNGGQVLDGLYLGNSVYSRGYDVDGTPANKTAYPVTLSALAPGGLGGNLVLFDNTDQFALVASPSAAGTTTIAKIIVSNDVPNYSDNTTYVAARNLPGVSVAATALRGLDGGEQPRHLASLPTVLDKPIDATGIALKLQTFNGPGDVATQIDPITPAPNNPPTTNLIGKCIVGGLAYFSDCGVTRVSFDGVLQNPATTAVTGTNSLGCLISGNPANCSPSAVLGSQQVVGYRLRASSSNAGLVDALPAEVGGTLTTVIRDDANPASNVLGSVGYTLTGRVVQTTSTYTQALLYPGLIQSETASATFDNARGLVTVDPTTRQSTTPTLGTTAGSNAGYAAIGTFGAQGSTSVAVGGGNVFRLPGRTTVSLAPASADATTTPSTLRPINESGRQDQGDVLTTVEIVARRPASEADMGRGASLGGAAVDVFARRYRVADEEGHLCASGDLGAGARTTTRGDETRTCVDADRRP